MKKKGNKKMPRPRQEIIDNPIPTSLFFNGVATHLQVFLKLHHTFTSVLIIASPIPTNNRTAA